MLILKHLTEFVQEKHAAVSSCPGVKFYILSPLSLQFPSCHYDLISRFPLCFVAIPPFPSLTSLPVALSLSLPLTVSPSVFSLCRPVSRPRAVRVLSSLLAVSRKQMTTLRCGLRYARLAFGAPPQRIAPSADALSGGIRQ